MKTFNLSALLALTFSLIAGNALAVSANNPVIAQGVVHRVIDGDTFVVNLRNPSDFQKFMTAAQGNERRLRYLDTRHNSIRVRLASIDTEESVHANADRNSAKGKETSRQVKQLIEKRNVVVTCYDWGRYGRSICNLEFDLNGQRTDLGEWLILNGHSRYVTAWGRNPFMHDRYLRAGRSAQ